MSNAGWRKIVKWVIIALGIVVALAMAAVILLAVSVQRFQASNEIAANVSIAGIDVSGLTAAEAEAELARQLLPSLPTKVDLVHPNGTYTIDREKLGAAVLPDEAVREAMAVARTGGLWERIQTRLRLWRYSCDVPLPAWRDQRRLGQTLGEIAAQINCEPVDAEVRVTDDQQVEKVPGKVGVTLQIDESQAVLQQALADPFRRTVELVTIAQPPSISTKICRILR